MAERNTATVATHQKDYKSLEEIWNDLLQLHWNYLDTEENLQKLEMRKSLEGELENFLCIVQHDRKFFLTETANVLKRSIMKIDDFTAYKAMCAFEAISAYASNLFRKPWRKEYRCIKMYSGYYQHEVDANLIGAEKLFEAMGYTLLSDQTLVLDGPICPDQVTNVSRDAMAAYVECQIMKQIFLGLTTLQCKTTWQEIYRYREMHIGTAAQAIAGMAYSIHERGYRKQQKQVQLENCYASIAPSTAPSNLCSTACSHSTSNHHPSHNQCINCKHHQQQQQPLNGIHATPCNAIYANPQLSCATNHNSNCPVNGHSHNRYNDNNYATPHHHAPPPPPPIISSSSSSIPHSKSSEHYHEVAGTKAVYHHHQQQPPSSYQARHSYDKPNGNDFTNHSYDCLDGPAPPIGHGHSFNDRYESHYAQLVPPPVANAYDHLPSYAHTYATPTPYTQSRTACSCGADYRMNTSSRPATNECHNYHPIPSLHCDVHGKSYAKNGVYGHGQGSGHAHDPYLINFDDKAPINGDRHLIDADYRRLQYEATSGSSKSAMAIDKNQKYSQRNRHRDEDVDYPPTDYYASHNDSKRTQTLKNFARNKKLLGEYGEHFAASESRHSRQSDFDSLDDSGNNFSGEHEHSNRNSVIDATTSNKIRDGVGSYETWNYVFQNIGKNGYNDANIVDDCDLDDLRMQRLDLNATPDVVNEKRRSRNLDGNDKQSNVVGVCSTGTNRKIPSAAGDTLASNGHRKMVNVDVNGMPKSMLKSSNSTAANGRDTGAGHINTITNDTGKKSNFKLTNGNAVPMLNGMSNTTAGKSTQINVTTTATASTTRNDSQQLNEIRSVPSAEWSCKFCTFLNPIHLRICQMCFKSQDFVIDAPKASTCV